MIIRNIGIYISKIAASVSGGQYFLAYPRIFSSIVTSAPSLRAEIAAIIPAAPPPTTMTCLFIFINAYSYVFLFNYLNISLLKKPAVDKWGVEHPCCSQNRKPGKQTVFPVKYVTNFR